MDFYEIVKGLCEERGITLAKMASEIDISNGTINAWKNGGSPKAEILRKIASYFDVSADYLLTGKEPQYKAFRTADEDVEIFEAIAALKRQDLRRLVLRLAEASEEEVSKVHGFLDLTQIGGSYGS